MEIYIENYGCSNNQAEGQIMAGLLVRAGMNITGNIEDSDIIILNTCIVKAPTESKMRYRISELAEKYPKKKLIVAGCMPAVEKHIIHKLAPSASLIDTHNIKEITNLVRKIKDRPEYLGRKNEEKVNLPKFKTDKVTNIVPISTGCLSECSYCIVKKVKGDLFSFQPESIIREIESAKKSGHKEFWLTSQDCSCYGFDSGTNLAELIKKIKEIKGKYFLRVGMMNPSHLKKIYKKLIEEMDDPRIYKFIHIPVQSGSDKILKKMNRSYTVKDFEKIIAAFREKFPEINVWTDIIVGFPGETEDDFKESLELLERVKPDFTNISRFGAMPGTKAAAMDKLPTEILKERSRIMTQEVERISLEQNKKWLGWKGTVLINEYNYSQKNWIARNYAFKQIILKTEEKLKLGDYINVEITDAKSTGLVGLLK